MLANWYLDSSVQNLGAPGVSGCIEHIGVLTQLIREARGNKDDLLVVRLDLTNAYGSMLYKIVEETLKQYHVLEKVRKLIKQYYKQFFMRKIVEETLKRYHIPEKVKKL